MPKMFRMVGAQANEMRRVAQQVERKPHMMTDLEMNHCDFCKLLKKHGVNDAKLAIELKRDLADMPSVLEAHRRWHLERMQIVPEQFTVKAVQTLSQSEYEAKRKLIKLSLKHYSEAKQMLCNLTGDKPPKDWEGTMQEWLNTLSPESREKMTVKFSVADFQREAVRQLNH